MAEIYLAPSLNMVSGDKNRLVCGKKSASVRQADVLAHFNPIWTQQKISSSTACVRQP